MDPTRGADLRKIIALPMLAFALFATLIPVAGTASAYPPCDSPDCVPNVTRLLVFQDASCQARPAYVFGLDNQGRTYVCATSGVWSPTGPLVGVRWDSMPCYARLNDSAQEPTGVPLICSDTNNMLRWVHRTDTPA
jgi:hypothetical protein